MKDISKCHGKACNKKLKCLRYTQPARAKWQSYLIQEIAIKDVDNCQYFIENEEK